MQTQLLSKGQLKNKQPIMNIREIKLALTARLMNIRSGNYLLTIQEFMQNFAEQVGAFIGSQVLNNGILDNEHSIQTLALQYENCTLNIDLVQHNATNNQYVNRFELF